MFQHYAKLKYNLIFLNLTFHGFESHEKKGHCKGRNSDAPEINTHWLELVFLRSKMYNFPGFLSGIASGWGLALIGVLGVSLASLSSNKAMVCDWVTLGFAINGLSYFYFQVFRFSGFCFLVLGFGFWFLVFDFLEGFQFPVWISSTFWC